jgi:hypothetical protein
MSPAAPASTTAQAVVLCVSENWTTGPMPAAKAARVAAEGYRDCSGHEHRAVPWVPGDPTGNLGGW